MVLVANFILVYIIKVTLFRKQALDLNVITFGIKT
tara:strand:+ start:2685 stop:2789 length:105 start_codon:yes stop_codon:yes gene_type:complete